MEIFLIILFVWLVPAWFSIRVNLLHGGTDNLDALDFFMVFFFIPFASWLGLFFSVLYGGSEARRRAFFIPQKKDRSVQSKIFWHNFRTRFFRLFLIKEDS